VVEEYAARAVEAAGQVYDVGHLTPRIEAALDVATDAVDAVARVRRILDECDSRAG
jgi:hypothetical protein